MTGRGSRTHTERSGEPKEQHEERHEEQMTGASEKAGPSIEDTPEFKNAVAQAVRDAVPDITGKILAQMAALQGGGVQQPADQAFAENLALAIASLTDQGMGRARVVAPAILRQRSEARELMLRLIVEARAKNEVPVYQLRNKVFLEEQLIDPLYLDPASKEQRPTEIEWRAVPSEAMIPMNDVAKRIFKAFADSIGHVEKEFERPLAGMTAGGLVIRTRSASVQPARILPVADPAAAPEATESGLRVAHKQRGGRYTERRVLGTVAPPAMQTT